MHSPTIEHRTLRLRRQIGWKFQPLIVAIGVVFVGEIQGGEDHDLVGRVDQDGAMAWLGGAEVGEDAKLVGQGVAEFGGR